MVENRNKEPIGGFGLNIGGIFGNFLGGLFKSLGIENLEDLLNFADQLAEKKGDEKAKENVRKMREGLGTEKKDFQTAKDKGLGGLLGQILNFVEKAQEGEYTREFKTPSGKPGVISFGGRIGTLKPEGKEEQFKVRTQQPRQPRAKREPRERVKKEEIREPEFDVYQENGVVKCVGEMPGIKDKEEIKCEFKDDKSILIYTTGERKYRKEITLPSPVTKDVDLEYKNGVVTLTLKKAKATNKTASKTRKTSKTGKTRKERETKKE